MHSMTYAEESTIVVRSMTIVLFEHLHTDPLKHRGIVSETEKHLLIHATFPRETGFRSEAMWNGMRQIFDFRRNIAPNSPIFDLESGFQFKRCSRDFVDRPQYKDGTKVKNQHDNAPLPTLS